MHFWLDTSAITKRYIPESGSAELRRILGGPESIVHIGQLVRTELASALARRARDGVLTLPQARVAMSTYLAHQGSRYRLVPMTEAIQREAERLVFSHPLRAADALHVASALVVSRAIRLAGSELEFVTADRRQAAAAESEGLPVTCLAP